jgi:hypothetical protein
MDIKTRLDDETNVWDCNFWVGSNNISKKNSVQEASLSLILEERKNKYNIVRTFFSHFDSLYYSPKHGNDNAASILQRFPGSLYGIAFMEQELFKTPSGFRSFLSRRHMEGFRVLRLLPKSHRYPFEKDMNKAFYEVLDSIRFPILVSLDELDLTGNKDIAWDKILKISSSFPGIPIILDGGEAKELMFDSYFFTLLHNSENIFFTTHNLLGFNQVEDLAGLSSKRLIFDTYFPFYREELSIFRMINAFIDPAGLRDILKVNMEKIINGIRL